MRGAVMEDRHGESEGRESNPEGRSAGQGRGRGRAIGPQDLLHAELGAFCRKVERARLIITEARRIGRVGVSFSGGKDSTVCLDLVRSAIPDAPAAFFDSGCELQSTREIVKHYQVPTIHPRMSFPEMARYAGWWGHPDPVDAGCPFAVKAVVIDEPAEVFVVRERLRVSTIGLRAEESKGRKINARVRGELYQASDRTWHLCPIAFWSTDDVWAYLASRELKYNSAYDRMTEMGIERERQRLGALLGAKGEGSGSFAILRQVEPETFYEMAKDFPNIRMAT